jgi:hypothetical protein
MRTLATVLGLGTAMAGLAVLVHQTLLWFQDGHWTAIPFSDVWFALGGRAPELLKPGPIQNVLLGLLAQPLCLILFLIGGVITWIGTAGKTHVWTKL